MNTTQSDLIEGIGARFYDRRMQCFRIDSLYGRVVEKASPKKKEQVLDVGCGTGTLLALFRRRYPGRVGLVGVDASSDMIGLAKRRTDGLMITVHTARAERLPFREGTFDLVVSVLAYHRMPPLQKRVAVAETARVLKPGGRFLLADIGSIQDKRLRLIGMILALRSHTRGNFDVVEGAMQRHSLSIKETDWHHGVVKLVHATKKG